MGSVKDEEKLRKFLQKVDDVDSIIKGLTSNDPSTQASAIARADEEIKTLDSEKKRSTGSTVGFDKTSINKNAYKYDESSGPTFSDQQTSQESFLAALEADSQKRAAARKERHQKANVVKERGNASFNSGDFENAVKHYSEAMTIAKDLTPLYTNRAAAYMKLEQFDNVISDCDFALRIDEKWIKAYVLKAKALQNLHKYDDAVKEFEKISQIDKAKVNLVESYISQLEKNKRRHNLEQEVLSNFENDEHGFVSLAKLIKVLKENSLYGNSQANNSLMYFAGGFQVLQEHLVDEKSKTLFRTKCGFDLFCSTGLIGKCIRSKFNKNVLQTHSIELVTAFLSLCTAACSQMAENLQALFSEVDMPQLILSFLEWSEVQVKHSAVLFFYEASLSLATRLILYDVIDCTKLSYLLLSSNETTASAGNTVVTTLCNFALDKQYCKQLQKDFSKDFINLLQEFIDEVGKSRSKPLASLLSYIVRLVDDSNTCYCLGVDESFQKVCIKSLEQCCAAFKNGLLNSNLVMELMHILHGILKVKSNEDNCQRIIVCLRPILLKSKNDTLLANVLQLVGLVLELHKHCVKVLFSNSGVAVVKQLFLCLKKDLVSRTHALKILCCAGQFNSEYIHSYTKMDVGYQCLRDILSSVDKTEEFNKGHVALLLGALSTIPKGMEPILSMNAEGDIVRKLLILCRESKNKHACANCAIALGKLSVSDNRFLIELREHDGINILANLKTKDILS